MKTMANLLSTHILKAVLTIQTSLLLAVKPLVISVIASSPTRKEIYGLDRRMNFYRSCDSGETWRQITDGYVKEFREEPSLVRAKSLPENLVSEHPTADLTAIANSTGVTWGGEF